MSKKYIVDLKRDEQEMLTGLIASGTQRVRKINHAHILLKADDLRSPAPAGGCRAPDSSGAACLGQPLFVPQPCVFKSLKPFLLHAHSIPHKTIPLGAIPQRYTPYTQIHIGK